jgi:1,4-alpha-glucan branching enzyme
MTKRHETYAALVQGRFYDPFSVLGPHKVGNARVVRTLQPQARTVDLIDGDGNLLAAMERVHADGLFAAAMPPRKRRYKLRVTLHDGDSVDIEDPYRFATTLGDLDLYLLGEGSDRKIYEKLGSKICRIDGISGTRFAVWAAVWAPNASRVSVIGDFNDWDGRRHVMRLHPANGIWEIFVPGVTAGARYTGKYSFRA